MQDTKSLHTKVEKIVQGSNNELGTVNVQEEHSESLSGNSATSLAEGEAQQEVNEKVQTPEATESPREPSECKVDLSVEGELQEEIQEKIQKDEVTKESGGSKPTHYFQKFLQEAVRRLDIALPGESSTKTIQKAQKIQERYEFLQNRNLVKLNTLEIEKALGITDVSLFPVTSPEGKDKIGIKAPFLDICYTFLRGERTEQQALNEVGEWNKSEKCLYVRDPRHLHQLIRSARTSIPDSSKIIQQIIQNVTGKKIVLEEKSQEGEKTNKQSASPISAPQRLEDTYITFNLGFLSSTETEKLKNFASKISEGRLCIPSRRLSVTQTDTEECLLKLCGFPKGGTGLTHALKELESLSLEYRAPFRIFSSEFSALITKTTNYLGKVQKPYTFYDPYTQSSYVCFPKEAYRSLWVRYWLARQNFTRYSITHESDRSCPSASLEPKNKECELLSISNFEQCYRSFFNLLCVREKSNYLCKLLEGSVIIFHESSCLIQTPLTFSLHNMQLVKELPYIKNFSGIYLFKGTGDGLYRLYLDPEQDPNPENMVAALKRVPQFILNLQEVTRFILEILPLAAPTEKTEEVLQKQITHNFAERNGETIAALRISWQNSSLKKGHKLTITGESGTAVDQTVINNLYLFERELVVELPLLESSTDTVLGVLEKMRSRVKLAVEEDKEMQPKSSPSTICEKETKESGVLKTLIGKITSKKEVKLQEAKVTQKTEVQKEKTSWSSRFFPFSKSSDKEDKKKARGFPRTKGFIIAAGAAVLIAGIIYATLEFIPNMKKIPDIFKLAGSFVVGVSVSLIGYGCAKRIHSKCSS